MRALSGDALVAQVIRGRVREVLTGAVESQVSQRRARLDRENARRYTRVKAALPEALQKDLGEYCDERTREAVELVDYAIEVGIAFGRGGGR